jgi:hypothetical protein
MEIDIHLKISQKCDEEVPLMSRLLAQTGRAAFWSPRQISCSPLGKNVVLTHKGVGFYRNVHHSDLLCIVHCPCRGARPALVSQTAESGADSPIYSKWFVSDGIFLNTMFFFAEFPLVLE